MKVKVKLVCERTIEINPENYPPNSSIENIIEMEKQLALKDPYLFIDFADKITVTAETETS